MDPNSSRGLWKTTLGFLARKRPEKTASPPSLRAQRDLAWIRNYAYLRHEAEDEEDPAPLEDIEKALGVLENVIQYDFDDDSDFVSIFVAFRSSFSSQYTPADPSLTCRAYATPCPTRNCKRFVI